MAFGGRSQLKMSEETFDFVCTACARSDKTVEAVKYCVECSGYCCQPCTDIHKNFPALSGHNISDITQATTASGQQSILKEFPTERCSIHKSKVMDMYCEHHDTVGCYVCFAKHHKSCQDSHIHSIPDMIETIYKLSDSKQTRRLLRDTMVSMNSLSNSKDCQLEKLNKAKKETLDKVMTFQKALEAILRTAAEYSRNEVEAAYKQLEKDIVQDKHDVDNIRDDLQTTDDQLYQSEGNRAQTFVCTKLGQEKIKEAENKKIKHELQHNANMQVSFIPDQSLLEHMKYLPGIGQVLKSGKLKKDLYRIKQSEDITIKLPGDSETCWSRGCCLTQDSHLLVTDQENKKIKRIDIRNMAVVDYCTLDSEPIGVCCISRNEVGVACVRDSKIHIVSILEKLTSTRQITTSHECGGIAFNDNKLYVTDLQKSLFVYGLTGTLLETIKQDNAGNKLFEQSRHITFNESGSRMFVGDMTHGLVCFDGLKHHLSSIKDKDIKDMSGVCVDGRGNVFVVGHSSNNVVQFSDSGKKLGVVVKQKDGLKYPISVSFHQQLNLLFVTLRDCSVLKMFELE